MDTKFVKISKIIIVLLIFFAVLLLLFKLSARLVIENTLVFQPNKDKSINSYTATSKQHGNTYYVQFKDVKGSSFDSKTYYNMDITIETNNQELLSQINKNQAYTVEAIRSTIGNFRREDVDNEQGRIYMKKQVKQKLETVYGTEIDGVYFEKFLYQTVNAR